MARLLAAGVVLLLLALQLFPSAATSTKIECSFHRAKNPSCGSGYNIDETCGRQCKSEGYWGWMCSENCTCLSCPTYEQERRLEREKIQKQQGNKGTLAAGVGQV